MAPEIVAIVEEPDYDFRGYDFQVDVWAAGCLLYIMLFGCAPFSGANQAELDAKILTATFTIPAGTSVSASAQALVKRMLSKDPGTWCWACAVGGARALTWAGSAAERISIHDALGHAWCLASHDNLLHDTHQELQRWNARRALRSSVQAYLDANPSVRAELAARRARRGQAQGRGPRA
jgi:serine/threonine protein kinase